MPHALHRSVRSTSSSPAADASGTIGAGTGLAARCDGGAAARGGSDGIVGWNWAPLARRGDGAAPVSSSVTDLMNSSSSTWAGFTGGSKGMRGRSRVIAGAAGRAGGAGAGAAAGLRGRPLRNHPARPPRLLVFPPPPPRAPPPPPHPPKNALLPPFPFHLPVPP